VRAGRLVADAERQLAALEAASFGRAPRRTLMTIIERLEEAAGLFAEPVASARAQAAAGRVWANIARRTMQGDDVANARASLTRAVELVAGLDGRAARTCGAATATELALLELDLGEPARGAALLAEAARLATGTPQGRRAADALTMLRGVGLGVEGAADEDNTVPDVTSLVVPEAVPGAPPAHITRWNRISGPSYTRVVVYVDRPVRFARGFAPPQEGRPARLFVDLFAAVPVPGLQRRDDSPDGLVRAVRVGKPEPRKTRVVLETQGELQVAAFPLDNPYRIVIDVGQAPPPSASGRGAAASASTRGGPPRVPTLSESAGLKVRRIALDAGHGGTDLGAVGRSGLAEKEVTLDIAQRLGSLLEKRGLEVVMVRERDETVALETRTARANAARADLFVSIHCNSSEDSTVDGVETFVLDFSDDAYARRLASRENATSERGVAELSFVVADLALRAGVEDSLRLAEAIQRSTVATLRRGRPTLADRGVRRALLAVLLGAKMPAVLVESPFVSNAASDKALAEPTTRERLARGIDQGIDDYLRERHAMVEPPSAQRGAVSQ
jgi:N-acetylmuramoyl-L-alanine amidase